MVKGHRPDTPVRPRVPVVLGDHHPTDDPCGATQTVQFDLETAVAVGVPIHIVPMGDQLWITAASSRIGRLPVDGATKIADCIADGWAFDGVVEKTGEGIAAAVVRGHGAR